MTPLCFTEEFAEVAHRIIWFEPPSQAFADSVRFMAYAMARATAEDMAIIRKRVSDENFIQAIDNAPPGIIDARSWAYWNLVVAGRRPAPPMPIRRLE